MQTHLSSLPLREESLLQNSLCRYMQEWEELDKYAFTLKLCKYVNTGAWCKSLQRKVWFQL